MPPRAGDGRAGAIPLALAPGSCAGPRRDRATSARARLVLVRALRLEGQLDQDREMVGADEALALDPAEPELGVEEDVMERPAHDRDPGVVGVEQAAPETRVYEPADALEQSGGVGPGDVVEIARHDRRL